jgi:hypothetical protein
MPGIARDVEEDRTRCAEAIHNLGVTQDCSVGNLGGKSGTERQMHIPLMEEAQLNYDLVSTLFRKDFN